MLLILNLKNLKLLTIGQDTDMKYCPCCKETKLFDFFSKNKAKKDGFQSYCKTCFETKAEKYKEKKKEYQQAYKVNNLDKHKTSARLATKKWKEQNKAKAAAYQGKRKASKLNATPAWLSHFDNLKINCLYQVARMRSQESGQEWHVDHIVPLKGKTVCGLHVPWNLRVITAVENMAKNNRLEVN